MRLISAEKEGEADHFELFVIDGHHSAVKILDDAAVVQKVELYAGQHEIW